MNEQSAMETEVLVIGGGNAALCAAMTASEAGADVLLLECAPRQFRGGNSRHTRNLRYLHHSDNAFLTGPYLEEEFFSDLLRVTGGRTNEQLARLTIRESAEIGDWMQSHGCRFQPPLGGTLHLARTNAHFLGGGKALMNAYYATAEKMSVDIRYESEVSDLKIRDGRFVSAAVVSGGFTTKAKTSGQSAMRSGAGWSPDSPTRPPLPSSMPNPSGFSYHRFFRPSKPVRFRIWPAS